MFRDPTTPEVQRPQPQIAFQRVHHLSNPSIPKLRIFIQGQRVQSLRLSLRMFVAGLQRALFPDVLQQVGLPPFQEQGEAHGASIGQTARGQIEDSEVRSVP